MTAADLRRFDDMPRATQAGILCNDIRFRRYAAGACDLPGQTFCASASAEFLRGFCAITSRRELNTSPAAAARFDALRTEFDAWAGKIARR